MSIIQWLSKSFKITTSTPRVYLTRPNVTITMIFFFISYIFFLHSNVTFARPLSFEIPFFYPREIDKFPGRFTHRSIWNIIWSCFATLFACSWVAIHPNIPAKSDSSVRRFLRRLMMMAYMLVIPEAVIYWAARQWWAARNIAKKHKDKGWTRTHGFFVSMGGFMLCDEDDNLIETLSIERLEELASGGEIRWPSISRDEIQDRSKGDIFSKGFAVVQTTWFITQCIARAVYGLTITQLELATLAFSVLNGVLYFLWWNKPQDVACPAPVYYLRHPSSNSKRETGMQTTDSEYGEKFDHASIHSESSSMTKMVIQSSNEGDSHREDDPLLFATTMESTIPSELHAYTFARYLWRLKHVMLLPLDVFWGPVKLMATCNSIKDSRPLSVPPFYAPYTDPPIDDSKKVGKSRYNNSESLSAILAIIVGILFGGIHCIAWSFTFQSVVEQSIWRFSAVTITATPLAWSSLEVLTTPLEFIFRNCFGPYDSDSLLRRFRALTGTPTIVSYIFSRAALLMLPLLALRSLSPDSLLEISWSSFIPHV